MYKRFSAFVMIFMLLFVSVSGGTAEDRAYGSKRKEQPLYVTGCDFAAEYASPEDLQNGVAIGYYPAGTPLYNWLGSADQIDIPENVCLLDWDGDSGFISGQYLSAEPDEDVKRPPVFVDYCEEWVSVRKKPNYSSERLAKLEKGTRIDHWKVCDSEFLYVEIDGYFGYVSLRYLRFPYFPYTGETVRIGNCREWVSMRVEADGKSERMMKVPLDTEIEMYQRFGDFYLCSVNGAIGYIHRYYIIKN